MTAQPVELEVALHAAQMRVWESGARFKVVACGRRFGKTFLAVNELIRAAGTKPEAIGWWVAPLLDQTDVAWRFFTHALPPELVQLNRTKKTALLWNGSLVSFKTAHDPNALRSDGLDFLVMDEAAFQKADVWPAALRPALSDKKGSALLIGTFDGENWFYDSYLRGQDPGASEWESWRFPSSANPFLDAEEIEEARRTLPEAVFEQEYMANPLVYAGAVFPGMLLQAALDAGSGLAWDTDLAPRTSAGLDWGHNTTAFEVCQEDASENVRWIDERVWHAVELNRRCAEIAQVCAEKGVGTIFTDAAGATENMTLATALNAARVRTLVQPVSFGKYKETAIMARRYYLERGMEAIGPGCPGLARDSKRYRYKEGADEVVKEDDHTVDAATCFYASKANVLVGLAGAPR